jgi:hypothetical protein
MTQQFDEGIIIDGGQTTISDRPLDSYFEGKPWPFDPLASTALRRGYKGNWTLRDEKLYLVELEGYLPDGGRMMLWDLFPDAGDEGVFAHWFTGTLKVPQGQFYRYSKPYRHIKPQTEIIVEVVSGCVTHRGVIFNEPPPPEDPPEPPKRWWQRLLFTCAAYLTGR